MQAPSISWEIHVGARVSNYKNEKFDLFSERASANIVAVFET